MIVLLALLLTTGSQEPGTAYRVRVPVHLQYVDVVVAMPRGTTRLLMDSVQAQHLAKGWATFIRDLAAEAGGRPLTVTPLDGAAWSLPPGILSPITVTYRVDLAFTRTPWPAGNEQAGAAFGDALYVVGRALFIASDVTSPSTIEFVVPEGWRVSTPWRPAGSQTFAAAGPTELTRNALVIGRHASIRVVSGPFHLELALPGYSPALQPLVEQVLRPVLHSYLDLFPGTPPTQYLMSFFPASSDDGESFLSSASFTSADSVTGDGVIVWGNFLAHELMHFWNGQRIRGAGPRTAWRWMAEGFTEYYANVVLARRGLISEALFVKKAERHLGNYLYFATAPALPRLSLVEAGSNTTANRFGVYDGGWTVAFCLDGWIRERSGDRSTLDDFMRAVWQRYGQQRQGYTIAALDTIASRLAGTDLDHVVSRYVETREPLPIAECARRIGWSAAMKGYAAEVFLFPASNAAPGAAARGRSLYGPVAPRRTGGRAPGRGGHG